MTLDDAGRCLPRRGCSSTAGWRWHAKAPQASPSPSIAEQWVLHRPLNWPVKPHWVQMSSSDASGRPRSVPGFPPRTPAKILRGARDGAGSPSPSCLTYREHAPSRALLKRLSQAIPEFTFEIRSLLCEGDCVAAEVRSTGRLANAAPYSNRYHNVFELRDGLILRIREYPTYPRPRNEGETPSRRRFRLPNAPRSRHRSEAAAR